MHAYARSSVAVVTPMVPDPTGPYSVGMVASGLLFIAGQRPVRKSDGKIPKGFADQVSQSLDNMEHVLQQAGCELGDIVKITAYLANLADFSALNDVFRARLSEPFPTRTTVGVSLRGVLVELDAYAVVPSETLPEREGATQAGSRDAGSAPLLGNNGG